MSKHTWTEAEETALGQMHQARCSTAYMANQLGRTRNAIRLKLRRMRPAPVAPKDQPEKRITGNTVIASVAPVTDSELEHLEQSDPAPAGSSSIKARDEEIKRLIQDRWMLGARLSTTEDELKQKNATIKAQRAALAVAIVLATMLTAIAGWQGYRLGMDQGLGVTISDHSQLDSLIGPIPVDPATGLELARFDMEAATDAPKAP